MKKFVVTGRLIGTSKTTTELIEARNESEAIEEFKDKMIIEGIYCYVEIISIEEK